MVVRWAAWTVYRRVEKTVSGWAELKAVSMVVRKADWTVEGMDVL